MPYTSICSVFKKWPVAFKACSFCVYMEDRKGLLLKRKDFLGVDEEAGSHPNRTYYFKKDSNLDNVIESCNKQLEVACLFQSEYCNCIYRRIHWTKVPLH